MRTRIESDAFEAFDCYWLDIRPVTVIVEPTINGEPSLFDALGFLSLLAQFAIRTVMPEPCGGGPPRARLGRGGDND